VRRITAVFEDPAYSDTDAAVSAKVVALMNEVGACHTSAACVAYSRRRCRRTARRRPSSWDRSQLASMSARTGCRRCRKGARSCNRPRRAHYTRQSGKGTPATQHFRSSAPHGSQS
jgi:hypothetical protein